ncbi:MAG TPA: hypothetical protein ENJ32_13850 [Crenotrichaceae bacterium]|nr:hypothetical protein [Crenotrichaceae bacterium]
MKTQYIVLILLVLFGLSIKLLTPDRSTQPVLLGNIDTSPEKQLSRQKVINKLKATGVIEKIETSGSLPTVYIGERFLSLTKDEKEDYLSTISDYSYTLNTKTSMVILKDPKTNKKIGKYSQNGLSMKVK